ncbi:MAG: carbamoyl-phosphate synthase large subunit, partial [Planctomycetia bacterium]|nr:carbamoyl-phosphate synthase large subunit [Planctomycetia bacterium]
SALASKATGFPIAKIAARLAVGYSLDELVNDVTGTTPACFEPALDYVVVKIPRFTFEKFPAADSTLGTQMKSVGEAMAIGRTFQEAVQKAIRSLETGHFGFGADPKSTHYTQWTDEQIEAELKRPNAERIYILHEALRRNWTYERLYDLTKIDFWYLRKFNELTQFEDSIKIKSEDASSSENLSLALLARAKELGFSDRQIAFVRNTTELDIRRIRQENGIIPIYGTVDTCAGEFASATPYYYSTWGEYDEPVRESGKEKILILGGGPNRIGQGIEFDYCCVHASFALRENGYETIMLNCNPETVSTDYDTSDKLYFEPLTFEDILNVYQREKCKGIIVQFGGQTPLNLAKSLQEAGAVILGTQPDDLDRAEDRDFFKTLAEELNIAQPANGIAHNTEEAIETANRIGYPVLVRPSFVLGGRAMVIVYKEKYLRKYMEVAEEVSEGRPILIDRFLENATEVDVDSVSDGHQTVIGAIMEHVEMAGIHSGDSACSIPPRHLSQDTLDTIRQHTASLAKHLNVKGLMNIQFAIQNETVYILEVNPRASRTVPFVSKSIGVPLAKKAVLCALGKTLQELNFTQEIVIPYTTFKEAVFPFV